MKKAELEKELSDLKVMIAGLKSKIETLEARPNTIFCPGHTCICHQHNPTTPYWPNNPWVVTSSGNQGTVTFPSSFTIS